MHDAMGAIMDGKVTGPEIGALLMGLRQRGETPEELAGAAEAMREHARTLPTDRTPLLDTCGTGGDGAGTFNISTAAAFVAAADGVGVAKHGNRSVSSACGSADVLLELGATIDLGPEAGARCLEETGIVFLYAPAYHPAARHAAVPRRELGIRTLFNLIGPLCNPAPVTHQVMGIFTPRLRETAAEVLGLLGHRRAMVVHGHGGLDEIALSGPTDISEWRDGTLRSWKVTPADLGLPSAPVEALRGGDAKENAAIIRSILEGETGPRRDVVAANAAAALYVTGRVGTLADGARRAEQLLDSGAARGVLEAFVSFGETA
jgi:anthranilate phosphoribosyltransferase